MSFRLLMALSCCLVYATTASAGITFIVDDTDDNKGFKSMSSTSTSCDPSTEHLYNGQCEKDCVGYFLTKNQADESKGTVTSCTEKGQKKYRYENCKNGWDPRYDSINNINYIQECTKNCQYLIDDGYYLCEDLENPTNPEKVNFDSNIGTVDQKNCESQTYCKYTDCKAGWEKKENGKFCEAQDCTHKFRKEGTPTGEQMKHGNIHPCQSGNDQYWWYKSCYDGWQNDKEYTAPVNGECNADTCPKYNNTNPNIEGCMKGYGYISSCKRADTFMYRCEEFECAGFHNPDDQIENCKIKNNGKYDVSKCKKTDTVDVYRCNECVNDCYEYSYNEEKGKWMCNAKFEKFCPYYVGDQIVGIVFDVESKLVMGLKNYGERTDFFNNDYYHTFQRAFALWDDNTEGDYNNLKDIDGVANYSMSTYPYQIEVENCARRPGSPCLEGSTHNDMECTYLTLECQAQQEKLAIKDFQKILDAEMGKGLSNTNHITAYLDNNENNECRQCWTQHHDPQMCDKYCTAAQLCANENLGGKNWFLPSIGEWVKGLGGLKEGKVLYTGNAATVGHITAIPCKNATNDDLCCYDGYYDEPIYRHTDACIMLRLEEASKKYGESPIFSSRGGTLWTSTEWIGDGKGHAGMAITIGNDGEHGTGDLVIKPAIKNWKVQNDLWLTRCFFKAD